MGTKARSHRILSPVFTDALAYTAELHPDQQREGPEPTPHIGHLLGVASLVLEHGGSETQAIAALLHDAIEDRPRGGRTEREIAERFGPEVLAIVEACTDSTDPNDPRDDTTWHARTRQYVAHVATMSDNAVLVSRADKLHNARKIVLDLREAGESVWDRFKATKDDTLRYYQALADELERTVRGDARAGRRRGRRSLDDAGRDRRRHRRLALRGGQVVSEKHRQLVGAAGEQVSDWFLRRWPGGTAASRG